MTETPTINIILEELEPMLDVMQEGCLTYRMHGEIEDFLRKSIKTLIESAPEVVECDKNVMCIKDSYGGIKTTDKNVAAIAMDEMIKCWKKEALS